MKIKDIFWISVAIVIIGYFIYKVAMNSFTDHFLGNKPKIIKAVIISEKNYEPNQPVRSGFTYSYSFTIDGQIYKGNSHDTSLKIGDSVEVKYNPDHPSINKPLHPKE